MRDKKEKAKKRFISKLHGCAEYMSFDIIVDNETGVQYLLSKNGVSIGMTPLLDQQGHPLLADKTN